MSPLHLLPPTAERILGIPRMKPMLAGGTSRPFNDDDWLFEVKWDGYRCLAYLESGGDNSPSAYLDSRNGKPLLGQFPSLSCMSSRLKCENALLDGEIVTLESGRVSFSRLRQGSPPVSFVAFDLLWMDGVPLLDMPLYHRKERLAQAMDWGDVAVLSEAVESCGKVLFDWVKERDMEGAMAKRKDSVYLPGERSSCWLKIRNYHEEAFWVVGYAPSPGRRIGSLLLALKDGEGFRYVGRVSSGLNQDFEDELSSLIDPPGSGDASAGIPKGLFPQPSKADQKDVSWIAPFFGVGVRFTEITKDGRLRHPVFREVIRSDA